ncbi:13700_t:CDS:2, partial [Gigaspora rosea]
TKTVNYNLLLDSDDVHHFLSHRIAAQQTPPCNNGHFQCGAALCCPNGQNCLLNSLCCPPGLTCGNLCCDNGHQCKVGLCCPNAQCRTDQTCSNGASKSCVCPTGQSDCIGACIGTTSDPNNCGGCGIKCGTDQTCSAGSCVCSNGLKSCSDKCTDTNTDPNNCGTCGTKV